MDSGEARQPAHTAGDLRVDLLRRDTRLDDDHRQNAEQERVLQAVNKGKVTAILDSARRIAYDGHANSSAKTIDAFGRRREAAAEQVFGVVRPGVRYAALAEIRDRSQTMPGDDATLDVTSATSDVWSNHVPVPGTPEGFTARTTYPTNPDGVEVTLERWQAGTEEPPHSHPGDDMTVVVEGKVAVQFYRQEGRTLVPDGERIFLGKGDVGYIRAGRVHDAAYVDACQLVYVHNGAFAFNLADAKVG